jgi:succinate dehydrogenase / fumarate reductase, cytochrome b subunit
MAKSTMLKSSIAKKVAMALSGLFLMLFLAQHFFINMTSVFSPDTFNSISHFMGNNPLVQYVIQPILIVGVIFHFIMGFVLDFKNRSARPVSYVKFDGAANSSWASRNMIVSGSVILAFLALHFYDFWFPEMVYKYVDLKVQFVRVFIAFLLYCCPYIYGMVSILLPSRLEQTTNSQKHHINLDMPLLL